MSCNKTIGEKGEETAVNWLNRKGYAIIERNWRYKHWELDIIASKGNMLHIIEVKSRSTVHFGYPEAAINPRKLASLKNGAEEYLNLHTKWESIQIDVLTITWKLGKAQEIFIIEDVY